MKFKIAVLFFAIIYSFNCFAQLAGYMGKRFSIEYSNYFSPALLSPTASSTDIGFNSTHSFNIDYAIKSKTSFCFGIQFSKTGILNENGYEYYYTNTSGYQTSDNVIYANNKKPMELKSTNIAIGFKFFRSGFIAPVGKYQKLEMILLLNKVIYNKNSFNTSYDYYYSSNYNITLGKGEYDFKNFAVAYTIGRQRIFFDKIILNTGIRYGISPNGIFNYVYGDFVNSGWSNDEQFEHDLKLNTQFRVLGAQLINLHIGIGFLAF